MAMVFRKNIKIGILLSKSVADVLCVVLTDVNFNKLQKYGEFVNLKSVFQYNSNKKNNFVMNFNCLYSDFMLIKHESFKRRQKFMRLAFASMLTKNFRLNSQKYKK